MSWSHALLGGKGPTPRGDERERDRRTDGHVDRQAHTEAGGQRGEGRKAGGDKKGSVRAGVHGGTAARRRGGAVARYPAPPAGTGAAMAVPFSRAGQSLGSPTPAPAPPRGDGARPGPLRPPRRWEQRQQRRAPTLLKAGPKGAGALGRKDAHKPPRDGERAPAPPPPRTHTPRPRRSGVGWWSRPNPARGGQRGQKRHGKLLIRPPQRGHRWGQGGGHWPAGTVLSVASGEGELVASPACLG